MHISCEKIKTKKVFFIANKHLDNSALFNFKNFLANVIICKYEFELIF